MEKIETKLGARKKIITDNKYLDLDERTIF